MPIHFDCTMCGRCCQDLKLPLSLPEAIAWLARGGDVQLLCEAFAWPGGYDPTPRAVYGWDRSFAAVSGDVPVRIGVTLVGAFAGHCPYLLADKRCGGYEDRPGVCRIYPAEINPTATIDPARKQCPPAAWSASAPLFAIDDAPVDGKTRRLIDRARAAGVEDIAAKHRACALLGIADAAFANEGFAVHVRGRDDLLAVLRQASDGVRHPDRASLADRHQSRFHAGDAARGQGGRCHRKRGPAVRVSRLLRRGTARRGRIGPGVNRRSGSGLPAA